jgi:UDP-glucose 4-epimerase
VKVLVTGGAGYIGSVVARRLRQEGHAPLVLDDLSEGHREATGPDLVVGDFSDRALVARLVREQRIEAVVHMAASCLVGESVERPILYYRNNLEKSLALLDVLIEQRVGRFVLSSTAAVYGEPVAVPIDEGHPTRPTNPYGETKLALERALTWIQAAGTMQFVALRYFNAAGATTDGVLGEDHDPETHLIPRVLTAAAEGDPVPILGTDYETHDGTAVRDYIHVEDLADAHIRALARLEEGGGSGIFNLGNGAGFSVRQVIEAARRVTGRAIPVRESPRRPGDPATLVASAERARRDLGWRPVHDSLEVIIESAWRFRLAHPRGYA